MTEPKPHDACHSCAVEGRIDPMEREHYPLFDRILKMASYEGKEIQHEIYAALVELSAWRARAEAAEQKLAATEADAEKYRAHSVILGRATWDLGVALGLIDPNAERHDGPGIGAYVAEAIYRLAATEAELDAAYHVVRWLKTNLDCYPDEGHDWLDADEADVILRAFEAHDRGEACDQAARPEMHRSRLVPLEGTDES